MARQVHSTRRHEGMASSASVDAAEIEKFARMAEAWWDPNGDFKPLHRLNPTRLGFIRDRVAERLGRDPLQLRPLDGLTVLDIGCGGGLLDEPLTRLGALVSGIDATEVSIRIARQHAEDSGLNIDYRCTTAEDLAAQGKTFDVVLNMEVIEHVADRDGFLAAACALVAPGGVMILSTINRTPKSFAMAIVGAEYVLRWLPRGTHDWKRFVRPSELARPLRGGGFEVTELIGVEYAPLADRWRLGRDLGVNYMALAESTAS